MTQQHEIREDDSIGQLPPVAEVSEPRDIFEAGYRALLRLITKPSAELEHPRDLAAVAAEVDRDVRDSVERSEKLRPSVRNATLYGEVTARAAIQVYGERSRSIQNLLIQQRSGQIEAEACLRLIRGTISDTAHQLGKIADRGVSVLRAYDQAFIED